MTYIDHSQRFTLLFHICLVFLDNIFLLSIDSVFNELLYEFQMALMKTNMYLRSIPILINILR